MHEITVWNNCINSGGGHSDWLTSNDIIWQMIGLNFERVFCTECGFALGLNLLSDL